MTYVNVLGEFKTPTYYVFFLSHPQGELRKVMHHLGGFKLDQTPEYYFLVLEFPAFKFLCGEYKPLHSATQTIHSANVNCFAL